MGISFFDMLFVPLFHMEQTSTYYYYCSRTVRVCVSDMCIRGLLEIAVKHHTLPTNLHRPISPLPPAYSRRRLVVAGVVCRRRGRFQRPPPSPGLAALTGRLVPRPRQRQ
jgi:hypothetical protein